MRHQQPICATIPASDELTRLDVRLRVRIKNTGRIKASDVCLGVEGYKTSASNIAVDSEIATHRFGRETTWRFWEFKGPIYPDFEIEVRVICDFAAELTSYVPGVSAIWSVGGGRTEITQAGLSWKIYADSAPTLTGLIPFESLPLSKRLFEVTEGSHNKEDFRRHFDPHKSLG